jgi:hypothetical protein
MYKSGPTGLAVSQKHRGGGALLLAAEGGYAKGGESLQVDSGSEEREVVPDANSASHASAATTMTSTHHVGQLAFDLWARVLIPVVPLGVGLLLSSAMQRFVFGVYVDCSAVLRRGTRIA